MNNKYALLVLVLILAITQSAITQTVSLDNDTPKRNSPYSRLGIGDPALQNYATSLGMGGLGAAFTDPYHVNLVNPASIGFLKATSFEVGAFARRANLETNDFDLKTNAGNFSYISVGFPMKNPVNIELDRRPPLVDWRMNFALTPYSDVGYNIESRTEVPGPDTLLTVFTGKGGTYKIGWTNAFEYKNLSVGLDIGYFFGNIVNERGAALDSLENSYFTSLVDEKSMSGFIWKFGAIYKHEFGMVEEKATKNITLGAYISSNANINTTSREFYRRLSTTPRDPFPVDTIRNNNNVMGSITLPGEIGIGIMYEKVNKFRVGIDYSASKWSKYTENNQSKNLMDTYRIGLGGEFIPDHDSYNRFWNKVRYRAGFHFRKDARFDEFNEQLTDTGVTIGMTLPVILPRGQRSWFNLAVTGGKFGTDGSLNETYIRANLGFTLNDNLWFYKRKFN